MKKFITSSLLCLGAILLCGGALSARADEASVKILLAKKYTVLPDGVVVRKLDMGGLYEVNLLGQEAYTNEKVDFLLVGGSLIDANKLEDVTAKRKTMFLRDFFLNLPRQNSIKTVYGKGEHDLISFEDPDCPLCKEQHAEWKRNAGVFNTTVHTFMFPLSIHPDAKRKAEFIWCQPDPSATWDAWMSEGKGLPIDVKGVLKESSGTSCKNGVDRVEASERLARALGYHETPRFIFANGNGASSVLSIGQFTDVFAVVEKVLKESEKEPVATKSVKKLGSKTKTASGLEKKK